MIYLSVWKYWESALRIDVTSFSLPHYYSLSSMGSATAQWLIQTKTTDLMNSTSLTYPYFRSEAVRVIFQGSVSGHEM
jgi:hypothetical protein